MWDSNLRFAIYTDTCSLINSLPHPFADSHSNPHPDSYSYPHADSSST